MHSTVSSWYNAARGHEPRADRDLAPHPAQAGAAPAHPRGGASRSSTSRASRPPRSPRSASGPTSRTRPSSTTSRPRATAARDRAGRARRRCWREIEEARAATGGTRERLRVLFERIADNALAAGPMHRELLTEIIHVGARVGHRAASRRGGSTTPSARSCATGRSAGDVSTAHIPETQTDMLIGAFYVLMFNWANLDDYPLRRPALAAARFLADALAAPSAPRRPEGQRASDEPNAFAAHDAPDPERLVRRRVEPRPGRRRREAAPLLRRGAGALPHARRRGRRCSTPTARTSARTSPRAAAWWARRSAARSTAGSSTATAAARRSPTASASRRRRRRAPGRSCERNQMIFVWHHAEGKPPDWEVPQLPGVLAIPTGRGRAPSSSRCPVHMQDMHENNNDPVHFHFVHGTPADRRAPRSRFERRRPHHAHGHAAAPRDALRNLRDDARARLLGPRSRGGADRRHRRRRPAACSRRRRRSTRRTPTRAGSSPRRSNMVDVAGEEFVAGPPEGVLQDMRIWTNKIHRARPVLCEARQVCLGEFRRWAQQFYSNPALKEPRMDRHLVISSDCHAGLPPERTATTSTRSTARPSTSRCRSSSRRRSAAAKKFLVADINAEWRKGRDAGAHGRLGPRRSASRCSTPTASRAR